MTNLDAPLYSFPMQTATDVPTSRATDMLQALSRDLTGLAERVIVGLNWTMVQGPGGIGLSHSPARGTNGCYGLPAPGSYAGQKLVELARLATVENDFERAIGHAAINAHHNRFEITGSERNGLDLVEARGERTVVIGAFSGIEQRLPGAAVIEREPRPGYYPESAAETLLPKAEQVVVTASALSNGSLAGLLELARDAFVVLVGPSAPLGPALFEFGVDATSGFVAQNPDALAHVIMEGGTVSAMRPHGRFVTLFRD